MIRRPFAPALPTLVALAAAVSAAHAAPPRGKTPPKIPIPAKPTVVAAPRDVMSDTWAATDSLGRTLPMGGANADAVRPPRSKDQPRFVGIFYFVWQGEKNMPGPYDIGRILQTSTTNPAWGPESVFHWWGEPEAGYFLATDPWVIRRDMALLQNAGVDTLLIDVTNAFTYPSTVKVLCETLRKMRAEGSQTPQIAFVTHAHAGETVVRLWNEIYGKNAYSELWFRWQGKPLLLCDPNVKRDDGTPLPPALRDFFTYRYSWAWDAGQNKWPWIEKYPQHWGWTTDPAVAEEMPVAVASHPTLNIGRSFAMGTQPPVDARGETPTMAQGLHFQEQWNRALEVDPQFVFVTGWNEWIAQRFVVKENQKIEMLGKPVPTGGTFFVDTFSGEYNRDIAPSRGENGDALYWQLVANIRKYKGVRPAPVSGPGKSISIDGKFADWANVTPEYRDAKGDTFRRDFDGWGSLHYKNATGRNDFTRAKVAYDSRNVYFYAETAAPITPARKSRNWMQLFIDADQNPKTGWHGYEYAVNLAPPASPLATTVSRYVGDARENKWEWQPVGAIVYRTHGNKMELRIPRPLLNLPEGPSRIALDFHWADNADAEKDGIAAFALHGDSAPDRSFNYRFYTGPQAAPQK